MPKISDKISVQILVQNLKLQGISHIVFSPGSRNAPFVLSFDEDPFFECIVIPDERSAAFFALGMSISLKKPVAVCCTSGSAVLNYYPAVAEAFYQQIPLIVLSADRPKEWIDHGDGQTIRQEGVLRNHIIADLSIEEIETGDSDKINSSRKNEINQDISDILSKAIMKNGPIHLNFNFSEPLYNQIESDLEKGILSLEEPIIFQKDKNFEIEQNTKIESAIKNWNSYSKRLILCGQMPKDNALLQQLVALSSDVSTVVLVENTSNLVDQNFVHCIDRTLNSIDPEDEEFQPEVLITLGGAIISKKIKSYLRKCNIKCHISVHENYSEMDTYRHLSHIVVLKPAHFLLKLNENNIVNLSNFGSRWKQLDFEIQEKSENTMKNLPFSDLTVVDCILDYLPENSCLHLANSSVIRYAQLFDPVKSLDYFSNRGTSGIDGSASTAAGIAFIESEKLNVLIIGDISFFYDSNAFWNNYLTPNLRIILITNGGGDIFNIIHKPENEKQHKKYFVTENNFEAEGICKAYHLSYQKVNNMEDLELTFEKFYEIDDSLRPKLLEIDTSAQTNHKILKEYFEKIQIV